jgi:hypothetical protein
MRRDCRRALVLVVFQLFLFLYMCAQASFFARWLMPSSPALAMLAAYGVVRLVDLAPRRLPRLRLRPALLLAVAAVVLLAQGLAASVRSDSVLAHRDTRTLARNWMKRHVPQGAGVVAEPAFPSGFFTTGGRRAPDRYRLWPIKPPFQGYEKKLAPGVIDRYRAGGYCWVITSSHQRQRGLKAGLRGARAYYARLDAESTVVARFSPWYAGHTPPEFNFDWSFDYYPRAYQRPGPLVEIHRLNGC